MSSDNAKEESTSQREIEYSSLSVQSPELARWFTNPFLAIEIWWGKISEDPWDFSPSWKALESGFPCSKGLQHQKQQGNFNFHQSDKTGRQATKTDPCFDLRHLSIRVTAGCWVLGWVFLLHPILTKINNKTTSQSTQKAPPYDIKQIYYNNCHHNVRYC